MGFSPQLRDEVWAGGLGTRLHTLSCSIRVPFPGHLKRGESVSRQRDNLVASVWRDRKLVYVMSTNSNPKGDTTVQRRERDGTAQQVPCPPSVVVYNKFMGGVDKADQLRKYYRVRCKTRKFYRYVFWFLFDSCIVNAFVLMKNFRPATEVTLR